MSVESSFNFHRVSDRITTSGRVEAAEYPVWDALIADERARHLGLA